MYIENMLELHNKIIKNSGLNKILDLNEARFAMNSGNRLYIKSSAKSNIFGVESVDMYPKSKKHPHGRIAVYVKTDNFDEVKNSLKYIVGYVIDTNTRVLNFSLDYNPQETMNSISISLLKLFQSSNGN